MARHKEQPFYVRSKRGVAYLDYRTTEGRKKKGLGFKYPGDERASPAQRAEAYRKGEAKYRELTDGRVVEADRRIRTTLTFQELYALYIDPFEPDEGDELNTRKAKSTKVIVLRSYGSNIMEWASDAAKRPDGTARWRGDTRTPLQRLVSDDGPESFLSFRLTRVLRGSMRKEKSNLVQFLEWAKANGYIETAPPVKLPSGKGKKAIKSGRGVNLHLTDDDTARIVACMPEWSTAVPFGSSCNDEAERLWLYQEVWTHSVSHVARTLGVSDVAIARRCARRHVPVPPRGYWVNPRPDLKPPLPPAPKLATKAARRFLVRPFFEFMWATGLRPVTIQRLIVGRNWKPGSSVLTITNADDKAKYGRLFPLGDGARATLEKYAPAAGHIFGFHSYRSHFLKAAQAVLDPERAALFGSYHLRHFVGTFLANRTTNLPAVQYVLGHTQLATTSGYVHADEAGARRLIEATESERLALSNAATEWAANRPNGDGNVH